MHIHFTDKTGSRKPVDLLGIGSFDGEKRVFARAGSLDASVREKLEKALQGKKFSGKSGETFFIPAPSKTAGAVLLIGLGKRENYRLETARRAIARILAQAKMFQHKTVRVDLDTFDGIFPLEQVAAACVEGARLSSYTFSKYKSKQPSVKVIDSLELVSHEGGLAGRVKKAISEAEIVSRAVYFTRDLANEPANVMSPPSLAKAAQEMARKNGLSCRVLGLSEIKKLGMGGIIGVCQGSSHEPRFVILENKFKSSKDPIVLVGKGVTFDTGGISIKPSNDMDKMKFDMCGAAAVMGAMMAIAHLKLPVKVIGITPLVENMPGGRAQRPGDIIKAMNGKTIEVLNTDAEGRLILADALSYAARFKPKHLIDIATLTGACSVTFADLATGVMGTDPDLVNRLKEAGEKTGERMWELPLWDEYFDLIKATYADIQNISKKYAGTITAGMFLKEFADHTKSWAHLDIAGTAWNEGGAKPLSPIGSTGVGVRLFVEFIKSTL